MSEQDHLSESGQTASGTSLVGRRLFLKLAGLGTAGVESLAGCAAPVDEGSREVPNEVHGTVYFPSRAFNNYQTWADYDPSEAVRDLRFVQSLNLDAVRVLLSFEFWQQDEAAMQQHLDHFLKIAKRQGISILPILFESVGREPTLENLRDRNLATSTAVRSPGPAIVQNRRQWNKPRRFVEWVLNRYGNHEALLAVEIMNEPSDWEARVEFCRSMLRAARNTNRTVPLTMGSITPEHNRLYQNPQLDVYQFHHNIPVSPDSMRERLEQALAVAREDGVPIWLTEWQRTRQTPPHRFRPNYSSLAPVVRDSEIHGDFFWQLMLKPAYGPAQRANGRLTGLFTEDGEVYQLTDARAISGTEKDWQVHNDWPKWVENPPRDGGEVADRSSNKRR